MANVNVVVLAGNLTRDPELKYIPSGAAVCDFSLAINRRWKDKQGADKEEVSFIDCVAWAKTAELVAQYLKKGSSALVTGEIKQERWSDKNGENRSRVRVQVNRVQFLGRKNEQQEAEVGAQEVEF